MCVCVCVWLTVRDLTEFQNFLTRKVAIVALPELQCDLLVQTAVHPAHVKSRIYPVLCQQVVLLQQYYAIFSAFKIEMLTYINYVTYNYIIRATLLLLLLSVHGMF